MSNQIALRVLTRPGTQLIAEERTPHPRLRGRRPCRALGLLTRPLPGVGRADHAAAGAQRRRDRRRIPARRDRRPGADASERGRPRLAARRAHGCDRHGSRARVGVPPRRRPPDQRVGREWDPGRRVRTACRHGPDLLLEGARLPDGRDPRRLEGVHRRGLAAEVPLRRSTAPGRRRRGGDALRARPQHRAARRRPRAGAASRRGARRRGPPRRRRRNGDELHRHRRRLCRSRRGGGESADRRGGRPGRPPASRRASGCATSRYHRRRRRPRGRADPARAGARRA